MTSEQSVCRVLTPWEANPYRLISWWDMEHLSGYNLSTALSRLYRVQCFYSQQKGTLIPEAHQKAYEELAEVVRQLNSAGLSTSADVLHQFCVHLLNWKRDDFGPVNSHDMTGRIGETLRAIQAEMTNSCFMHIPTKRAEYYGQDMLFGGVVFTRFEAARYDIREAGNCLAAGRATACVYHLMRALEVVLSDVGSDFGLVFNHTNWQNAIDQLESSIKKMQNDPVWTDLPNWKEKREFYAQIVSYLALVKDAWRNFTAHARGKYDLEEAELMLLNVRAFMQKVANKEGE